MTPNMSALTEDWSFEHGDQSQGLVKIAGYLRRAGANEQEIVLTLYAFRNRFADFSEVEHEIGYIAHEIAAWRPAEVKLTDIEVERRERAA